tara:strand:- start:61 stop:504 length:444 start_codon:yes stop_codon:yes gene_type:complete
LIFNNKYSIFLFVFIALVLGGLSSSDTANDIWYQDLNKSNLNPPGFVFGIVWPILYILMSISAFRTFDITRNLFLFQLVFNTLWSWLFFGFNMPVIALVNIWFLIVLNIILFIKMIRIDALSGILLLPYVIWLIFASYLNLYIVINN